MNSVGLLPPQIPHAETLLRSIKTNGYALDFSEVGTGKTYCAAAIVKELGCPVVVICPKAVIPEWVKVLRKFGIAEHLITVINYEKIGHGNTHLMKWKKSQNPANPTNPKDTEELPHFKFSTDCLVVLDEGHKCKGLESNNSKMMICLKHQGYRVLVASATAANSPLEMKALGYLSNLHSLKNFKNFCMDYGAYWLGKWGVQLWDSSTNGAKDAMVRLNTYFFDTMKCASRMTRDQFGTLFPESHISAMAYNLGDGGTKSIQAVYDKMEQELDSLDRDSENYANHVFSILMLARRKAELIKVPIFVEMVEDLYREGKSVVVFVNFTDTATAISSRLKKYASDIGYIIGGQTAKERQRHIEEFQSDKKRIMIVNIAAGSTGVNLHDLNGKFPRASVISPTWSSQLLAQSLGRIWRAGGVTKSLQRICYAAKCIEEQICERVQFKINATSTLNDGELAETVRWIESGANLIEA